MVHCIKSEWNELRNAEISMSIFGNSEWTHWKLEQCGAIARHKWKICPLQLLTVRPSAQVHISARHNASELWWMKLVGTMHLKVVNMILFTAVRHHWFLLFLLGLFWFLLDETVWFLGGTEFFFQISRLVMKTYENSCGFWCEHMWTSRSFDQPSRNFNVKHEKLQDVRWCSEIQTPKMFPLIYCPIIKSGNRSHL